ncbi:MAG: GNAT family N-acetyltransferase, partial [Lachnospiraceae bacterium]|nr:GNAT family N-acetyltransferase [Lachnospiraceae bacterium]
MVREVQEKDLNGLLELYLHLHEESVPELSEHLVKTWQTILADENHHIIVKEINGTLVSSCVCVIIPNLTRGIRPYAFV